MREAKANGGICDRQNICLNQKRKWKSKGRTYDTPHINSDSENRMKALIPHADAILRKSTCQKTSIYFNIPWYIRLLRAFQSLTCMLFVIFL